ncbi:MAG: c-type cytochrome [Burkholderiales bacterium]
MASPPNEFHIHEHYSPIKTPQQLVAIAVLSFVVPVLLIVGIVQLVLGGMKVDPKNPMFSEEATAKRLQPVGQLSVGQSAAPSPPAPAPVAAAKAEPASGDKVYQASCAMCHDAGVAGAPKFGDKGTWKARIAQGQGTLHEHALKGIRMMPAKGGNTALADAEVKAAVDYMVSKSK